MAQLGRKVPWELMNPILAATVNPIIANPMNSVSILPNISLASGTNVINHKLGKLMTGWMITDIQGVATIYRSAPMNDLTLTLTVSAPVVASIGVF